MFLETVQKIDIILLYRESELRQVPRKLTLINYLIVPVFQFLKNKLLPFMLRRHPFLYKMQ